MKPLDLDEIRERWKDADEFSGTMRWNPIVRDLVEEVERLREALEAITANDELWRENENVFAVHAARRMYEQAAYALGKID